jgi:cytidine deaminase
LDKKKLIHEAFLAREKSYSPYSNFCVGAALLASNGTIYQGCNIENSSYTPTNCAERTAFFKAVSEGVTSFDAIVIVGGKKGEEVNYCAPCGVCRQVMMEFCDPKKFIIILAKSEEEFKEFTLEEMLPLGFGPSELLNL